MVTAAIAYDEIVRLRPDLLPALGALLDAHPDRAPFQVAIDRTIGAERQRRMFLECARWPDDARQTPYDHPTWHAALTPLVSADAPAEVRARAARRGDSGEAIEAVALNFRQLGDPRAAPAQRAFALCWLLHVVGDLHQPLHAAERFSAAWPNGDGGGGLPYVRDPLGPDAISLHWLWDDAILRSGVAADVDRRAREIEAAHPRAALAELKRPLAPQEVARRAHDESYALAESLAYGADPPTSARPQDAPAVPPSYWSAVRAAAETRVAIAGYRIADLVIAALGPPAGDGAAQAKAGCGVARPARASSVSQPQKAATGGPRMRLGLATSR
jgi:hypothetical protein